MRFIKRVLIKCAAWIVVLLLLAWSLGFDRAVTVTFVSIMLGNAMLVLAGMAKRKDGGKSSVDKP